MAQYHLTPKQKQLLRVVTPGLKSDTVSGQFGVFHSLDGFGIVGTLWESEAVEQADIDVFVEYGFLMWKGKSGYSFNKQKIIDAVDSDFEMPPSASGSTTVVYGDVGPGGAVGPGAKVDAGLIVDGDLTISGSNVNIRSKLENVTQTISTMSGGSQAERDKLAELMQRLFAELGKVPEDHADDVEAVGDIAQDLVETASSEKPNKSRLRITADGLKKAAENLAAVAPAVLGIATTIVKHVFGMANVA